MIVGGYLPNGAQDKVVIIDMESATSTCEPLTNKFGSVFGTTGLLNKDNNPIYCGGYDKLMNIASSACFIYDKFEWKNGPTLNNRRNFPAMTVSPFISDKSSLFIVGGKYDGSPLSSAEVLTETGRWQLFTPSAPVTIHGHCLILVNQTTVMIIGGFQNDIPSANTFMIGDSQRAWTKGPVMSTGRVLQGCAKIRKDGKSHVKSIIVAGGYLSNVLNSVEILNEKSTLWYTGPYLPVATCCMSMTEDPRGGVLMIGGWTGVTSTDIYAYPTAAIYRLKHGNAEWQLIRQKISSPNYYIGSFLVPDYSNLNCTNN